MRRSCLPVACFGTVVSSLEIFAEWAREWAKDRLPTLLIYSQQGGHVTDYKIERCMSPET